jgi:hypothetical protein
MGTMIFIKPLVVLFAVLLGACSVLENGYMNQYGIYVPKHPKFKLKDKPGVQPKDLDTTNIYVLAEWYHDGQRKDLGNGNKVFLKFHSNGRCFMSSFGTKDSLGNPISIGEADLDPKMGLKSYYYSPDGQNLQIEEFVRGDGQGHYVVSNYMLSNMGDTLINADEYTKMVFQKMAIPINWHRYKADW